MDSVRLVEAHAGVAMQLPRANWQASNDAGGKIAVRIAALASAAGILGSAAPIVEVASMDVTPVGSWAELLQLARGGTIDAIVADPELVEGWPADVAAQMAGELQSALPLILVCRAYDDARLIEARLAGPSVSVVQNDGLTPELLANAVTGALATHRARPQARG